MTLDEAKAIARIVGTADGGCPSCVGNLVKMLNEKFTDFTWKKTNNTQKETITGEYSEYVEWYIQIEVEPVMRISQ